MEAPGSGGLLMRFALWMLANCPRASPASIKAYVSEVSSHIDITTGYKLLRSALLDRMMLRCCQLPRERSRLLRVPATSALIRAVATDTLLDPAIRVAIVVSFHAMLRVREFCSEWAHEYDPACTLLRQHVRLDKASDCVAIRICHTKSDPYNSGNEIFIARSPIPDDPLCPVAMLLTFLETTSHRSPSLPLFELANGSFLTRARVTAALQRHAASVGLVAARVTSHSIRAGGAFAMSNRGVDWLTIRAVGRWRSDDMAILYSGMSQSRLRAASSALSLSASLSMSDIPLVSRVDITSSSAPRRTVARAH